MTMAKVAEGLFYSETHEWVRLDGDEAYVGITDYAQHALGSIVYVDMPDVDDEVVKDEEFGAVESVKAASDLVSPVSGTVTAKNDALDEGPGLLNSDPYGTWIIKVRLSDTPGKHSIILSIDQSIPEKDGYRLDVSENRITVEGQSEAAVFYGVQTIHKALPITVETGGRPAVPAGSPPGGARNLSETADGQPVQP